jgi:hypothetical protein
MVSSPVSYFRFEFGNPVFQFTDATLGALPRESFVGGLLDCLAHKGIRAIRSLDCSEFALLRALDGQYLSRLGFGRPLVSEFCESGKAFYGADGACGFSFCN